MTREGPTSGLERRGEGTEHRRSIHRSDGTCQGLFRSRAPLRLGLAGGGTDVSPYCDMYGGYVLNGTISMYAYATVEPWHPGRVLYRSAEHADAYEADWESEPGDLPPTLWLHHGVARRVAREFNGGQPLGVALTTSCDAPPGSGLGSSSAIVVAMVEAMKGLLNLPLGEYDVARLAYEIERIDVGLAGGRQDQYAATFGGFNFMEFYDEGRVLVNPLRVNSSMIAELEASMVLFFTGRSRSSAEIIEAQAKSVHSVGGKPLQSMHVLKEDALAMKEQLLRGSIRGMAEVLARSWIAKKGTSDRISTPEIERVHRVAVEAGAYAGKISGAGGGGFFMFMVDAARRAGVVNALSELPGQVVPCHFAGGGSINWAAGEYIR